MFPVNPQSNFYVPQILEIDHRGGRGYDIWSKLLKDRVVFLGTPITDEIANLVVAQLLFLEQEDSEKEISLYINSPGGYVTAGMAIYDTMQYIRAPISTVCMGQAASMAAVLLAAGTPGKRYALPFSRVMIHQPSGGAYGQVTDLQIQAAEIAKMKTNLTGILAKHTGQSFDKVLADAERDYYMSAVEAKDYGLVDKVVTKKAK